MLLINRDHLTEYRPTAEIPHERIDPYIRESQEINLCSVLGFELYYDFMNKVCETSATEYNDYQNLLNGTVYTLNGNQVEYKGIIPYLAYCTLARVLKNQQTHITRFGVVQKSLSESQPVTFEQLQMQIKDLYSISINYQTGIKKYLENNSSTYPLFDCSNPSRTTSFKFFSA